MDLVNTGIVAFVAFVFIGGSIAYVAGPPPALEELAPDSLSNERDCGGADACDVGPKPPVSDREGDDEGEDDDEDDDDDDGEGRGEKGKKRGKD